MSQREGDEIRDDADLERALRDLPVPAADPAFRDRLREQFVSGSFPAAGRRRRLLPWGLAAAAALLAAVGVFAVWPRGEPIRVFDVAGTGTVEVAGEEVDLADRDRLEALLAPGVEVSVPPSATLDLVVGDVALFEVTGGTRMTLPSLSGGVAARVDRGEVRFASGPGFPGRELRFTTPEGLVVVTGTLLSVQCDERGTCVCVLEGTARVGVSEADLEPIPAGRRKVMPRGGAASISPVAPPHEEGVLRFVERSAGRFPRD